MSVQGDASIFQADVFHCETVLVSGTANTPTTVATPATPTNGAFIMFASSQNQSKVFVCARAQLGGEAGVVNTLAADLSPGISAVLEAQWTTAGALQVYHSTDTVGAAAIRYNIAYSGIGAPPTLLTDT